MSGRPTIRDREVARSALALLAGRGGMMILARRPGVSRQKLERAVKAELQKAYDRHQRYWKHRGS